MRKNSYFLTLAVPSTLPVFHCILFLLSCFLLPLSVFCPIVNTWYSLGLYHRSNQFAHLCLMIFLSPAAHLPGIFLSFFATLFCPLPWWLCLQLIFLHSLSLLILSFPLHQFSSLVCRPANSLPACPVKLLLFS